MKGVAWRSMTFGELLWLHHTEQIQHFHENDKRGMRRYLIETGDEAALIAWDREQMTSSSQKGTR